MTFLKFFRSKIQLQYFTVNGEKYESLGYFAPKNVKVITKLKFQENVLVQTSIYQKRIGDETRGVH
jgi:hypothetical protein